MNHFEVDEHPQYPHGQCISVDRIEYEISRHGYFRHPRLGRLYGKTLSRRAILVMVLAWIVVTVFVQCMANIRLAEWARLAADQNDYIFLLKAKLVETEGNTAALADCRASVGRITHGLNVLDNTAHDWQKHDPQNPTIRALRHIAETLKAMLDPDQQDAKKQTL